MSLELLRAYVWFRWRFSDGAIANRLARVAERYWAGEIAG